MHEVALSQQLARVVSRAARGRPVTTIRLDIGALRQVVPETLVHAWTFVSARSGLAGSTLIINEIDAVVECENGHTRVLRGVPDVTCHRCEAPTRVIAGNEFRVVSIDVKT
ncbi:MULTISPECIES: hydrogenase maturation nickel metallochaperone HypA [Corynebacterium]|uniref:Hydrogenase maturation nickel metallochaperone HypA n=1 Tax=Corynebacterium glucuronolyticum TaxID=39791 RepID=A0AAX1L7D2_9CORY|nr:MULTISPECIES: hydrogenase maturation nickel metallochaperone HypA [Corynebacterium]MCT1442332.1 hydrogenase maturation nickel metallochaperone HypA [Corynebacterium glucuronolyticum]MCT1563773.1 hydrogenase maturation nickel metallochaperone HypA [Corynebacterium glucuronolyticum]OFO45975.1 hydrogenase expression protein HypD [Corynebacterium sp. HMSC073D01]QQU88958.1 hydrogenase maturation nickel metallochaperone HypA [Corynebacterium glucuronolyticum]QRO82622.1 hydrogenase maturation nick